MNTGTTSPSFQPQWTPGPYPPPSNPNEHRDHIPLLPTPTNTGTIPPSFQPQWTQGPYPPPSNPSEHRDHIPLLPTPTQGPHPLLPTPTNTDSKHRASPYFSGDVPRGNEEQHECVTVWLQWVCVCVWGGGGRWGGVTENRWQENSEVP